MTTDFNRAQEFLEGEIEKAVAAGESDKHYALSDQLEALIAGDIDPAEILSSREKTPTEEKPPTQPPPPPEKKEVPKKGRQIFAEVFREKEAQAAAEKQAREKQASDKPRLLYPGERGGRVHFRHVADIEHPEDIPLQMKAEEISATQEELESELKRLAEELKFIEENMKTQEIYETMKNLTLREMNNIDQALKLLQGEQSSELTLGSGAWHFAQATKEASEKARKEGRK